MVVVQGGCKTGNDMVCNDLHLVRHPCNLEREGEVATSIWVDVIAQVTLISWTFTRFVFHVFVCLSTFSLSFSLSSCVVASVCLAVPSQLPSSYSPLHCNQVFLSQSPNVCVRVEPG